MGEREHLKPRISKLQPGPLVVGIGCVFSLASALVRIPAVFLEPIRWNDLLRATRPFKITATS
jgi:hypothetical protein